MVYLTAPATTRAQELAPVVAQISAANAEARLLVKSREVVRSPWPPQTPESTKKYFEDLIADHTVHNASAIADRVKAAISGCPAIAKRIQELGDGASSEERVLAFPRGLRDCKCAVDVAKVEPEIYALATSASGSSSGSACR